jgi:hypothetical protein
MRQAFGSRRPYLSPHDNHACDARCHAAAARAAEARVFQTFPKVTPIIPQQPVSRTTVLQPLLMWCRDTHLSVINKNHRMPYFEHSTSSSGNISDVSSVYVDISRCEARSELSSIL